jgi:hypothetical protein
MLQHEATAAPDPTTFHGSFGGGSRVVVVDCDDTDDLPDWYDHEEADFDLFDVDQLEAETAYAAACM